MISSISPMRTLNVAEAGGESGACWAVIRSRWHQFLFGFYPPEQYWRPVLTGGLLLAALAPILFWKDQKGAHMVGFAGIATLAALYAISANSVASPARRTQKCVLHQFLDAGRNGRKTHPKIS